MPERSNPTQHSSDNETKLYMQFAEHGHVVASNAVRQAGHFSLWQVGARTEAVQHQADQLHESMTGSEVFPEPVAPYQEGMHQLDDDMAMID